MRTDFHSHILPGIDDGSQSTAESLAMLRALSEQGISRVMATPHFYPHSDNPDAFLKRRAAAMNALRQAMEGETGLPAIELGAEVYYFPGISDCEILPQLTIGGKRCILIEMPPAPWTEKMYRELEGIYTKQRLQPILAHIDRYIRPFRTFGIPKRLEDMPVLVQANASFFLSRSTASMAVRMLREGRIHLLGSDCHNMTDRAPDLGAAAEVIRNRCGLGALRKIEQQENAILQTWQHTKITRR